jgi:ABC-2 type transport system permease protein
MRFSRGIEEILIAPFSYIEMIIGLILESVARAIMVASLILIVGVLFGAVSLVNPFGFFMYITGIAIIFALVGILVALWAESFEQLQMLNTFFITPLTYLGGIFYSVTMLPPLAALITHYNPFFYFADGVRSSMIGVSEAGAGIGVSVIVGLVVILGTLVFYLFKIGWKIRS